MTSGRRKPRQIEFPFHVGIVRLLQLALPKEAVLMHVPNQAARGSGGKKTGGQLKAMGMLAGAPDLFIFWNAIVLPIELKIGKGTRSDDQHETHKRLSAQGFPVYTCWTPEDVEAACLEKNIPLRIRLRGPQPGYSGTMLRA